ncbi:TrkA family potassium uptake protein [Haloarcula sp. JP-L23]|uniref:potassium channel family protein n=1 Tax=Haloarcula sp. JP-L23 TaxID=2716717 RepID=UPI00140ECF99|nr:potassium channel protein [Haloarcula sp. JP-L23]
MSGARLPLGAFVDRPLLRRMLRPVGGFATVVVAGVLGFSTLGGVGVVDALFWLLDPTSIELHFQTHEGPATLVKAYAIVVLSGLVVAGLWIGETLVSATFGGTIQAELRQMQIERSIDELDDHVVVCGYGTFGKTVCAGLDDDRDMVVIERQETQYDRAIDDGYLALTGDARREEVLEAAGIDRAETVVGAIDDADTNIQITITGCQLAPGVDIVVRAGDSMHESIALRAGADEVVIPEVVSGQQVSTHL